jgi:hypothetical protein
MSRKLFAGAVALALTVPVALAAPAEAKGHVPLGASCSVFSYVDAHWASTLSKAPVVTHSYQLNLPHHGTFTQTESESAVHVVSSTAKVSASLKASEGAIFESVEVTAKTSVAKFGSKTSNKSVSKTISISNTGGQTEYIMFQGVTHFTGTAKYYNCVSRTSSGIGTVKVIHSVPVQTYSGAGGGAVQCGVKTTSALAKAAQKYC